MDGAALLERRDQFTGMKLHLNIHTSSLTQTMSSITTVAVIMSRGIK
jgi:hypothetical protein